MNPHTLQDSWIKLELIGTLRCSTICRWSKMTTALMTTLKSLMAEDSTVLVSLVTASVSTASGSLVRILSTWMRYVPTTKLAMVARNRNPWAQFAKLTSTVSWFAVKVTPAYVNVTRPVSGKCPSGTQLCSTFTNATNSICATSLDQCPITDVLFVLNADVTKYNTDASVVTSPYYKSLTYTTTVTLLYSQQVDSMPITTF